MASIVDIQYHYDVNNDFYACFLDKNRVYSCGVWKTANDLEEAQIQKLNRLCRYANLLPGHRLIDIGCGWGGLMQYAASHFSTASVHGLTLSQDQFKFIKSISSPAISVDLCAWQDFLSPKEKYDAIISIGAFEHFASLQDYRLNQQRNIYRQFFEWCQHISTPHAQIGLQTIISARSPDRFTEIKDTHFLLTQVFPGSVLPTISDIQAAMIDLYEISTAKRIGLDYVKTIQEWHTRLEQKKNYIIKNFSIDLFRHYSTYFSTAIRSFQSGIVDLWQISLTPILHKIKNKKTTGSF